MAKYHVGKDGTAKLCSASVKLCPLGEEVHGDFSNELDARAFAETVMNRVHGGVFAKVSKTASKTEDQRFEYLPPLVRDLALGGSAREQIARGAAIEQSFQKELIESLSRLQKEWPHKEYGERWPDVESIDYPDTDDPDERQRRWREGTMRVSMASPLGKAISELIKKKFEGRVYPTQVQELLDYYEGKYSWIGDTYSRIPERLFAVGMHVYSEARLEQEDKLHKALENPDHLKTKAPSAALSRKLETICADKGLELQEVILVEPKRAQKKAARDFATENEIDFREGTELLMHGTNKENILNIFEHGVGNSEGVVFNGSAGGTGYYFSPDPAVAGRFGEIDGDGDESYIVLCQVVTGGPERTQNVKLGTYKGHRDGGGPATLGKNKDKVKNVSRRTVIKPHPYMDEEDYEEVLVKDSRQIIPVGIMKVKGKTRRPM